MNPGRQIIKISNDGIYFNQDEYLKLSRTNFPNSLIFKSRFDIIWEIELINFDFKSKKLTARINNYNVDSEKFLTTNPLKNSINFVDFKEIDWDKFERLLSSYQKSEMVGLLSKESTAKLYLSYPPKSQNRHSKSDFDEAIQKEVSHNISFNHLIEKSSFKDGFIEVSHTLKILQKSISFKIYNNCIIPQFDFIKSYFEKLLKTKYFKIKATITISGNEVISKSASSNEIDQINQDAVNLVKIKNSLDVVTIERKNERKKIILNLNELLTSINKSGNSNIFEITEEDLVSILVNNSEIRNKSQIDFLVKTYGSSKFKISFTPKPYFGFMFYIDAKKLNYICWELLDSHATYLWALNKEDGFSLLTEKVEESINYIYNEGRNSYKSNYSKELVNLIFHTISHNKIENDEKLGFKIWKNKLLNILN